MGNTDPLLVYSDALVPIVSNHILTERTPSPDVDTETCMFISNGTRVRITGMQAFNTNCGGSFCDKQGLISNGEVSQKCACYQMLGRTCRPCIAITLAVTEKGGKEYIIKDYCSDKFLRDYVLKGGISMTTRRSYFDNVNVADDVYDAIDNVLTTVNDTNGWTLVGRVKPGMVEDQATKAAPGAYNPGEKQMISSGVLIYRVTRLVPSRPETLDVDVMTDFKIDLEQRCGE